MPPVHSFPARTSATLSSGEGTWFSPFCQLGAHTAVVPIVGFAGFGLLGNFHPCRIDNVDVASWYQSGVSIIAKSPRLLEPVRGFQGGNFSP